MCALSFLLVFAMAHVIAWFALGGGWRGAARAPFVVFVPATAMVLLDAVFTDSYTHLVARLVTLLGWEAGYFFFYLCLRICSRAVEPLQLTGPTK